MTGGELKALVAQIPDDATVVVSGPDEGGFDAVWHHGITVKEVDDISEYAALAEFVGDGDAVKKGLWVVEGSGEEV